MIKTTLVYLLGIRLNKKKPRRHGDAENHAAKMTGWMDPGRSEGVREEGGFR